MGLNHMQTFRNWAGLVVCVASCLVTVQAFGQERREAERFSDTVESAFGTARRRIKVHRRVSWPGGLQG